MKENLDEILEELLPHLKMRVLQLQKGGERYCDLKLISSCKSDLKRMLVILDVIKDEIRH